MTNGLKRIREAAQADHVFTSKKPDPKAPVHQQGPVLLLDLQHVKSVMELLLHLLSSSYQNDEKQRRHAGKPHS